MFLLHTFSIDYGKGKISGQKYVYTVSAEMSQIIFLHEIYSRNKTE